MRYILIKEIEVYCFNDLGHDQGKFIVVKYMEDTERLEESYCHSN
jgi:hypothetical protein